MYFVLMHIMIYIEVTKNMDYETCPKKDLNVKSELLKMPVKIVNHECFYTKINYKTSCSAI